MGYWSEIGQRDWFERLSSVKQRRYQRLVIEFYSAYCAYRANPATPENPPSLVNWERSPTSVENDGNSALATKLESADDAHTVSPRDLTEPEIEGLKLAFRMGVEDVDRAVGIVAGGGDRLQAIHAVLERDQDRQWKVLALLERGDVAHALRLATCGRRSVQLECPEHAGGCGCQDNYVPMHCDSRLCPDCHDRKKGQNIGKYRDAVFEMDTPQFQTYTIENVEDPVAGREKMMEDLRKLRRRTIPFEGSVTRQAADGDGTVTKSWSWWDGVDIDDLEDNHTQWKIKLQEEGRHDLVRRLQKQFVNYEYRNITGTHVGRNIPFDELYDGGIYGIDVKQKGPFEFNVHAHVLVDSAYIPQAALSAVWEDISGSPVVDARRVNDRSSRESVAQTLQETVGYATKPPEFEELEDELAYVEGAKGCPEVHPFGSLHGAGTEDISQMLCSRCERTPYQWEYLGTTNEAIDNMGKGWETDRGKDPPDDD
jgi:hypothetical protein